MKSLRTQSVVFLSALFLLLSTKAYAETPFIADQLIYNANNQTIEAVGDVEIDSENGYFYLEGLVYDINTRKIVIRGNIRGVLNDGVRIKSDFASLDPETKELILRDVNMLLQSNLQLVASYIRENDAETYGEQVIASSCEVCITKAVPIWQIRADQILRDKVNRKIYFRKATLEAFGVPIFYLPNMRIPDVGVERMSGFLRPKLVFSDLFLNGIKTPYFHTFGEHADLMVTPYLSTLGVINLQSRFRQEFKGGSAHFDGAYSFNDGEGEYGRYYGELTLSAKPIRQYKFDASYTVQSDYDFAPNFNYDDTTKNYAQIIHANENYSIDLNVVEYRPSSEGNARNENPVVMPSFTYQYLTTIGNRFTVNSEIGLLRLARESYDDVTRGNASFDVNYNDTLPFGVTMNTSIGTVAQVFSYADVISGTDYLATRTAPYAVLDLAAPLSKTSESHNHLLVPRAQLIWSENTETGGFIENIDSTFVEYDYSSLFALNRFSGSDRLESGMRLNLGTSYVYSTNEGQSWDGGFGRVVRYTDDVELAAVLDNAAQDGEWIGYINYIEDDGFTAYARGSWDEQFQISRLEMGAEITSEDYGYSLQGVHLAPEPELGFETNRSEVYVEGFYHFAPHWQVNASASHDLISGSPFDASFDITYGNECIEISAGLIHDSNRGEGIDPETSAELSVTLIGIGDKPIRDWPRRQCSAF